MRQLTDNALNFFVAYTFDNYENVTGVANGGKKYVKSLKSYRDMTEEEKEDGKKTLRGLAADWHSIPKFEGDVVFRVIHEGSPLDKLQLGETFKKKNPTSTS